MLRDQRRAASAIAAPASGRGGQNFDAAFILVDAGPRGYADPAFDAHLLPIGQWASAVWGEWLPVRLMQKILTAAVAKIDKASNVWAVCYGPDAATITTDDGELLQLTLDSPAPVAIQVRLAVKRW